MTTRARAARLMARLVREMGLDMPGAGIAFMTPVGSVAGASSLHSLTEGQDIIMGEVTDMPAAFLYELIIAIINRGHVDTVMDAAPRAVRWCMPRARIRAEAASFSACPSPRRRRCC